MHESVLRMKFGPRRFLDAMRREQLATPYRRIAVEPLGATIGAEIRGVDLREPLDDETFAEIERAHLHWKVIFFRDQDLSSRQHLAFAGRFGALEEHPFLPAAPSRRTKPAEPALSPGECSGTSEALAPRSRRSVAHATLPRTADMHRRTARRCGAAAPHGTTGVRWTTLAGSARRRK